MRHVSNDKDSQNKVKAISAGVSKENLSVGI
jgi:hypothetical protein